MRTTQRFTALFLAVSFMALGCAKKKEENPLDSKSGDQESKPAKTDTPAPTPVRPASHRVSPTQPSKKVVSASGSPRVLIKTSMGDITVQLDPQKAPISVKNFLRYINEKHYDGTIFHRVISTFMIQGGGFTPAFKKKPTHPPIKNEATNGLKHVRGTIAMARTMVIDSASAQFFINVKDNMFLNHRGNTGRTYGYAVFGKVIKGMDVVDKIKNVQTGARGPFPKDVPLKDVLINSIRVISAKAAPTRAAAPARKDAPARKAALARKAAPARKK